MLHASRLFSRRLLRWYDRHRRDLPWRVASGSEAPLDPYHVLVSEAMLQQTQVATVIPYFNRFIARFPTLGDLAAADEQEVLRAWQGLGYYSRARNLRAAARVVMTEHGGRLPSDPKVLLTLPGVGRYTAGAVASIAFDRRAPILDGNVARVLCRLDRIEADPRDRATQDLLWRRAEEVLPAGRVGDFNSALMELGAMICTPRTPQCLLCPVRKHCEAFAAGAQDRIPSPRKAKPTPLVRRRVYCVRRGETYLIEQRPPRGRWAGMWQFLTTPAHVPRANGGPAGMPEPVAIGKIHHALTHRRYEFEVFLCRAASRAKAANGAARAWVRLEELDAYPLPRPHLRIAEMLRAGRFQ